MKVAVLRNGIVITPEGTADELYLELALGLGRHGAKVERIQDPKQSAWGSVHVSPAPAPLGEMPLTPSESS